MILITYICLVVVVLGMLLVNLFYDFNNRL